MHEAEIEKSSFFFLCLLLDRVNNTAIRPSKRSQSPSIFLVYKARNVSVLGAPGDRVENRKIHSTYW